MRFPGLSRFSLFVLCIAFCGTGSSPCLAFQNDSLEFNRDIRPILADKCFHCHGFDVKHREADLRLDDPISALAERNGSHAIVPGKPDESQLVIRVLSSDEANRMPPVASHKVLSDSEKNLLRRWVAEGAHYSKHWAFIPPRKADLRLQEIDYPNELWRRSPMDAIILRGLHDTRLPYQTRTSPEKWYRRAALDLTGLAPSPIEVDRFLKTVSDRGEAAYGEMIDELLASPRFGERMAQEWMDAARYADTHGFNNDTERSMWRWRDWVINAFNDNVPYDQFLVKQLAGDLLPNPTLDDLIATGFCRNHVINSEGGIIDEEYRNEYVVDRVRTLGTSILGLTLECARCHDHKYDPLTQKDYYQLYAFFNQVDEIGEDGRDRNAFPFVISPTKEQQDAIASLQSKRQDIEAKIDASIVDSLHAFRSERTSEKVQAPEVSFGYESPVGSDARLLLKGNFVIENTIFGPSYQAKDNKSTMELEIPTKEASITAPWSFSTWIRWSGLSTKLLSSANLEVDKSSSGYGRGLSIEIDDEGHVGVQLGVRIPAYALNAVSVLQLPKDEWTHVLVTYAGKGRPTSVRVCIDGQLSDMVARVDGMSSRDKYNHPRNPRLLASYSKDSSTDSSVLASFRWSPTVVDRKDVRDKIVAVKRAYLDRLAKRTEQQERRWVIMSLLDLRSSSADANFRADWDAREELNSSVQQFLSESATTMVMREIGRKRETHVLYRGQYNAPRERVEPNVPESLLAEWPASAPKNRLGLAKWLTRPDHPLTSRVAVNRFWQQVFGVGLVKSSEDFGLQGEYPPQKELLDWLARDFVDSGWNVKRFFKQLLLSETYRQESSAERDRFMVDPENRYLGRGPRVRLNAESIRDHLLQCGGLLKHRLGGPSVFPVQPADLYKGIVVDAAYEGTKWGKSQGEDLFRRSLYTFWKRTVPFPMLNVFDAPDREFCIARRSTTNTPLQALTLLNEPSMVAAAQGLARRVVAETNRLPDELAALGLAFRIATGRNMNWRERDELAKLYLVMYKDFESDTSSASRWLTNAFTSDSSGALPDADPIRMAALAAVCNVILNLDETITKD